MDFYVFLLLIKLHRSIPGSKKCERGERVPVLALSVDNWQSVSDWSPVKTCGGACEMLTSS